MDRAPKSSGLARAAEIAQARECGAQPRGMLNGAPAWLTFTPDALSTFVERIRSEERQKVMIAEGA